MSVSVSIAYALAMWGSVAWFVGFFFQVMDALGAVLDLRLAKDTPLRRASERRRITENIWALVGIIFLAVIVVFGVQVAARFAFDWNQPYWAVAVLVGLVLLSMVGGLGILAGVTWREDLSYAVLRGTLAEDAGARLRSEHVASFRAQLGAIDARRRHIRFGLRDRAGLRPVRVKLDEIADSFAVVPPTGFGAVTRVRWKTANAYLWLGNPVRLLPSLVAVIVVASSAFCGIWGQAAIALAAAVLSFLLALLEARLALASKAAWHAVYQQQRLEAVKLLEELERSSRKGVAGLGERVSRALQILRDQQN